MEVVGGLEQVAAVEARKGAAEDGEFDRQRVTFPAAGKVGGRTKDVADRTVRKSLGIKTRSLFGVAIEPQDGGEFGNLTHRVVPRCA